MSEMDYGTLEELEVELKEIEFLVTKLKSLIETAMLNLECLLVDTESRDS